MKIPAVVLILLSPFTAVGENQNRPVSSEYVITMIFQLGDNPATVKLLNKESGKTSKIKVGQLVDSVQLDTLVTVNETTYGLATIDDKSVYIPVKTADETDAIPVGMTSQQIHKILTGSTIPSLKMDNLPLNEAVHTLIELTLQTMPEGKEKEQIKQIALQFPDQEMPIINVNLRNLTPEKCLMLMTTTASYSFTIGDNGIMFLSKPQEAN